MIDDLAFLISAKLFWVLASPNTLTVASSIDDKDERVESEETEREVGRGRENWKAVASFLLFLFNNRAALRDSDTVSFSFVYPKVRSDTSSR